MEKLIILEESLQYMSLSVEKSQIVIVETSKISLKVQLCERKNTWIRQKGGAFQVEVPTKVGESLPTVFHNLAV